MWERIVERLLEKYLSKYIEGIEKEKLRVGVLRGDVELEDLKVKQTALDDCDLGVSIVYGNVGRLSIGISWAKWMSQDFNLRLKIKNVHILLKPRAHDSLVSEEQLREKIRDVKEKQIIRLQKAFIDSIQRTTHISDDSTNTTFLMNFTSRLIRNIEIDIMDVHIAFHDPSRHFTIGCELIIGSLQSATLNKVAELLVKNKTIMNLTDNFIGTAENVSQCVEFRGFSVYVGLSRIAEWDDILAASMRHDPDLLKNLVTRLLTRIQTSLGGADDDLLDDTSDLRTNGVQDSFNALELQNKKKEKQKNPLNMRYILLPLHLSFLFTSISTKKHIIGLFQIHKESQGIVIGKAHLKIFLELLREIGEYRDMCQRILMPDKNKIEAASMNSLEETRKKFCALFKRKIREDAEFLMCRQPLTKEERESLTFYHDYLSTRNLAKWRAACYMEEVRLLAAKQSQIEEELAQARKQQTWWVWATRGSEDIQAKILEKLQQENDSILTSDERKFVSEEILTKFADDFVEGPHIYELSFELQNFHILIHDTDAFVKKKKNYSNEKNGYKRDKPFLQCNLHQVQAHIWINSCLDRDDKEAYEWRWKFCMSGFHILHRNHTIVVLKGDALEFDDTKLKTDQGNLQDLRHVVSHGGTLQKKQTSVYGNTERSSQSDTKEEDFDLDSLATVWNFERRINKVQNELHIFIRMAPLNCFMYQHVLRNMISFTHSILGSDTETPQKELQSLDTAVPEHVFNDGVSENYERLRKAAQNESQNLINIHMVLCAPIVYYKTCNNSDFIVHFGELCIDTQEPCTLHDLKIQAKLNNTQVYCSLPQNNLMLPLLRPVSISVCANYKAATTHLQMDVVLHEVFIELNFLAIEIILQMLVELISCVSQKHKLASMPQREIDMTRVSTAKKKEPTICLSECISGSGPVFVEEETAGSTAFVKTSGREWNNDVTECSGTKEAVKDAVDVKSRFSKVVDYQVFACTTSVFVRRIGFSMLNQTSMELLRAGAVNTFIQVSMDAHCKDIKASILLDTLFASDPSSKTPLFLTQQENSSKIYDSELFGNTDEQSDFFLKKNLEPCSQTSKSQANESGAFVASSSKSEKVLSLKNHWLSTLDKDLAECCARKIKSQERDALHAKFESFPHKKLLLTIKASCAIHWQKESIKKILEAVQQSRELINNFIKKQLKLLDYQKQSGVTVQNSEHSLSLDATDALYYTFTLLDEWLHLSLNDNVQSSNQQNLNNGWDTPLTNTKEGLPCLNANGSLPEFSKDLPPTIALTCHITLHTASFIFYSFKKKFAESSLSGITMKYTKYQSRDAELKIFIKDLNLHLKKKCILSSGSVFDWQNLNKPPSDIKCEPFEKTSPLFQMHMRFYKRSHVHTEHNMVYSSCFSSYLSNLTYVYYQKDVSQLYAYLCDGILDVILRKSYQVAYKLAKSSICLFGLYIKDAVVLVPEDKSCIPQSSFYVEKQDSDISNVSPHFGSLIDFHVSSLSVRNSYTFQSNSRVSLQHTCTRNELSNYLATFHFDLTGLTAFMRHSEKFKSFSKDINGQILQSIDGFGTLQGGELIVIDARLSQFHLSLIREQLTLLLDILNENFSGLGYQPNDIELGCHDFLSKSNDLSSCDALDQCMASTDCSEEMLIVEHLKELFSIPPVRVSCRIRVDSINLNLAFSLEKPLALCVTRNNCFACDVSLYGLYLTYQFSFLAESLVVEDIRKGSLNRYKRFLECFSVSDAMKLNENSHYTCDEIAQKKYEYHYGDDLPGTTLQWMRPGIELKPLVSFEDSKNQKFHEDGKVIHESVSFSFTNNVKTTRLSASLWNPNLFLFTVGMQDVLSFVVASFSFSTMRRYPKPIAMVVPKLKKKTTDEKTLRELIEAKLKSMIPSTRPFLIDVTIKQGVFNFFSQLETLSDPIIQFKGDFNFKAQSMENYLLFNLIQLHNCIISKVKIMPFQEIVESTTIVNEIISPGLFQTTTTSFLCKPLFKVISSVVINKAFSIKASGLLETLFDAVTKTWYPSKISFLHDKNETKEKPFQFLFSEMASSVMKEASMNQISLFTLHVEIPECVLHLSIQDFVVLCCALRNINRDHVSIFSKVPYPPIVAVDATVVDSSSTIHSTILQTTGNDNEHKSKVIGNESYIKLRISCEGLRVVIFDDRLTMPTPILKCCIVATSIKLCSDPNKFCVNFDNMLLSVDFMSDGGSVWQPFIEEFNVSWCFESNVKDSMSTCASETLISGKKCSALNISKEFDESGLTVQEERAKREFRESKSKTGSDIKPFHEEWYGFAPSHSLCFLSNKALLINVTPYLCQLLTWFSSSLQETFEHFLHDGALKSDKERNNKTKALTATSDTHTCTSSTQCNSERTYSYMNLTGENFLAFSINSDIKTLKEQNAPVTEEQSASGLMLPNDERKPSSKDCCLSEDNVSLLKIDSSQKLIPTNIPRTLNDLAVGQFTQQFRFSKRSAQEFEIFVFSEIPKESLERLKEKLPFVPDQYLLTSLYETRSERLTLNFFLSLSQLNSNPELKPNQLEDILKSHGSPAPYLGQFPRRMQVVPIVLSRADTKLIPLDFEATACSSYQQVSSKSVYQKATSGFGSFVTKPKIVARVLSTHPSYKLLMLTTGILLENHTGFPLQISFLYNGHEPVLMKNPEKYCTPCSSLQGTISHDTCSSKIPPVQPTPIQSRRQLQYPELNDAVTQEAVMFFNTQKLSYSVCLLNDHVLSIPPEVFIHPERVVFSFRPAYMEPLLHRSSHPKKNIPIPTITVDQGWTGLLDINCADRSQRARKPYIRSCRIPFDPTAVIKQDTYECVKGDISKSCKTKQIHMSVITSEVELNSSEDASLYVLKIFPAFTIVNACPILLNCHLYLDGKSSNYRMSNDSETTKAHPRENTMSNRLSSATKEDLYLSISPFTIYHVLSIHAWTDKASLRMRVRFTLISEAEWSKSVKFPPIQEKDDVMSRLLLNCGSLSCIEIEVYKRPYHFLSDNEILSREQKGCLLSCPRWLVNRTNVNLSILDPTLTYMNVFPIVDNICLLGNSKKTEIQLVNTVPGESSDRVVRSEKFSSFVEIPAVGGFSNAFLQTTTLYYVFTLETVHLSLKDVYGATFRCVTICPKYIFINTFNDNIVYIRQATNGAQLHNSTKSMTCSPKTSLPLYWTQSSNPLFLQFKIGDSYAWSGSICPHDEYVGGHDIAVYDIKQSLWTLFHIQIIVEKGKFFIVLRTISDPIRSPLHSIFVRNHLEGITACFHTFHTRSTTSVTVDKFNETNQAEFQIPPHETRLVAWPFPFAYDELNCDIALMSQSKQFLRTPAAFSINLHSNCYRRCLEIKNIPLLFRCFVIIMTRGSTITIDIAMETVSLSRADSLLRSNVKKNTVALLRKDSHRHLLKMKNNNDSIKNPPSLQITVYFSQIGLSCVSALLRQELLYAEVSSVCGAFLQQNDNQLFEFSIKALQMDSQLEACKRCVFLAQRDQKLAVESGLKHLTSPYHEILCSLLYTKQYLVFSSVPKDQNSLRVSEHDLYQNKNMLGMKFHNMTSVFSESEKKRDSPTNAFIHIWVERESVSNSDLFLKDVEIILGDLELDIDAEMLNGLQTFSQECLDVFGFTDTRRLSVLEAITWNQNMTENNIEPPILGKSVTLKQLNISKFSVFVWCSLLLDKLDFLSDFLKLALRILMVSPILELTAAPITFQNEIVNNSIRGSLLTLVTVMKARYLQQLVSSLGAVLGYSSLANIPRAPLDLFRGTVGLGLTVADNVSSGLGTVLSNLTFDADYITRREQAFSNTPITVKDGLVTASKDLKEGFISLGEVVTKTIGGAQKGGFPGFLRGLGKGVAGTIIKPVDKLSQAISNVAFGIRAEYGAGYEKLKKMCTERRRKPRMLSGASGMIMKYDIQQAELRECLSIQESKDILCSISLSEVVVPGSQNSLVLIYAKQIRLIRLTCRGRTAYYNKQETCVGINQLLPPGATNTLRGNGSSARIIWTLNTSDILNVRASSNGVMIRTNQNVFQIPCNDGVIIKRLYEEIVKSQQRTKYSLYIENIVDWIGASNEI